MIIMIINEIATTLDSTCMHVCIYGKYYHAD